MIGRMLTREDLTLAVLAGGKGTRLGGVAKGLLIHDGASFISYPLALGALAYRPARRPS